MEVIIAADHARQTTHRRR